MAELVFRVLSRLGVSVDTISREEAARDLVGREVSFRWAPVIVEPG